LLESNELMDGLKDKIAESIKEDAVDPEIL
jgi:hypothetical protein